MAKSSSPATSLADTIGERVKGLRAKSHGFWDALPADKQDSLLEVKRRYQAGEYGPSATRVARLVYEECQVAGINTCRMEGLIKWLKRPMER